LSDSSNFGLPYQIQNLNYETMITPYKKKPKQIMKLNFLSIHC